MFKTNIVEIRNGVPFIMFSKSAVYTGIEYIRVYDKNNILISEEELTYRTLVPVEEGHRYVTCMESGFGSKFELEVYYIDLDNRIVEFENINSASVNTLKIAI